MPANLKRHYGRGDLHFVSFICHQRLPLLAAPSVRNFFVETLSEIRNRHRFLLVGYVVMPEHVHLLISETSEGNPSLFLQALKQRVSRDLREKSSPLDKYPRFWQPRFHDFNVYSFRKRREKLDYMHLNPVHRRLVSNPADWPWSSYLNYERGEPGLIPIDFVD